MTLFYSHYYHLTIKYGIYTIQITVKIKTGSNFVSNYLELLKYY